jgi:hypothetical protein
MVVVERPACPASRSYVPEVHVFGKPSSHRHQIAAAENELRGTVSARLGAQNALSANEAATFEGLNSLWLQIEESGKSNGGKELMISGDSDGPMKIGQGLGLYTEGGFRWRVEPIRGAAAITLAGSRRDPTMAEGLIVLFSAVPDGA